MEEEEVIITTERDADKPTNQRRQTVKLTLFLFFLKYISRPNSYPRTHHSSAFGQAHIAMVILVKRLTFGPC